MAVAPKTVPEDSLPTRLAQLARLLQERFLGKDEVIRLLIIAAIAGEHAVLIGPPGTAKSALIRTFARLIQANYFEYLLTRFTEPNEIFGPVDISAFREGRYERRTEGMLPEAEIVFLDEVFKSNSAILNALLTLLNERRYTSGGHVMRCPLLSAFGASNEVPGDETLTAIAATSAGSRQARIPPRGGGHVRERRLQARPDLERRPDGLGAQLRLGPGRASRARQVVLATFLS